MKPRIDKSKCTNCGQCVKICPVNHFKQGKKTAEVKSIPEEECLECMACVINCPGEAIELVED